MIFQTSIRKSILYQISAHLQGRAAFFLWVTMHLGVFPAIAEVGLVAVVADDSAFPNQPEALRRLAVVFVYLGQAVREFKALIGVDRMVERQFQKF